MKSLVLKNRSNSFGEILTDIDIGSFKNIEEQNNDRSIEFKIYRTQRNMAIFDNLIPDMLLNWEDNDYTVISVKESDKSNVRTKEVTAKHVFMETQFIYIDKDLSQESLNETDSTEKKVKAGDSKKGRLTNAVADTTYQFLISKGFKDFQAFGVLGNAKAESNLNPNAEQYPGNRQLGGKGLLQWDDRKYKLYSYADENNASWQDLQLQLNFMWLELTTTEQVAYQKLINSNNVEEAALNFHDYYERSADNATQKQRRVKYAKELQNEFNSNQNKERANSSYLDISKGINFNYDPTGSDPNYPFDQAHYGIDINYIYENVYSTVAGTVTVGFDANGFGNYVMINAGDGLTVYYGHLSKIIVGDGEDVTPGTLLGVSGNTGLSSGPHLHYEMRQDNKPFNPIEWINSNLNGTSTDEMDNANNDNDGFNNMIPTYTLREYLDYGFKNNTYGFTYEIYGEFPERKQIKDIGGHNLLEHLTNGADIYNYIYHADNRTINIYSVGQYGELADEPLIYNYNTDEITVTTDIKDLETYISGYGAKLTKSETANYTPIKVRDVRFSGTFNKKGTYYTEQNNASYSATLKAKYGNEMLQYNMKKGTRGGLVQVKLDGNIVDTFDTYSESAETEKVIIGTKLSKGKHTIQVTFKGASKRGKYDEKKPPRMYVGSAKTTLFNSTAILTGKQVYKWFREYRSPNYDSFMFRQAPTLYVDNVDTAEELEEQLAKTIKDTPTVEVTTSYIGSENIKHNSIVRLVHKPMNFNTDLSVVKITKPHPYAQARTEVEFSNAQSSLLQIQRQLAINLKNNR